MKSKPVLLGLLMFLVLSLSAQYQVGIQKTIGGNNYETLRKSILYEGKLYLLGYSDSGPSGNKTSPNYGKDDYWLLCLDSNLNVLWQKSFGGDQDDFAYDLLIKNNRIYLFGQSGSGINGTKNMDLFGGWDLWLICTDLNGNEIWQKQYGGSSADLSSSIYDFGDNIILSAISNSPVSNTKTKDTIGAYDYYLIAIDTLGNQIWDKVIGGDLTENRPVIYNIDNDNLIVAGTSYSNAYGDKTEPRFSLNEYESDIWMLKYNISLDSILWDKTLGGPNSEGFIFGRSVLIEMIDNYLYVANYSNSGIGGSKTTPNIGGDDIWVNKITTDGQLIWDKTFGGDGDDIPNYMFINSDSKLVIGGYSSSDQNGHINSVSHGGGIDALFFVIDTAGNYIKDYLIGGSGSDGISNIFELSDGRYLVAAGSSSPISGDKNQNSLLTDLWIFYLDLSTGISEITSDYKIFAYPNPASDQLYISLTASAETIEVVQLLDLQGKVVMQKELNTAATQLDIRNLPSGAYLIRGYTKTGKSFSGKFLKE